MTPNGLAVNQEYGILNLRADQIYSFSEGIPGFEKIKQYCLLYKEEEMPFLHLSAVGGFNLEFIVVSPWMVLPSYKPEISDEDIAFIGAPSKNDLIVLAMVVISEPLGASTVNMVAPVIINSKTGSAKQVVIRNLKEYTSQQPIITENSQTGTT